MESFEKSSVGHTDDLQQTFDRLMEIKDIWERAIEMKEFLAFCEEEISKCDKLLTQLEMEDGEVQIEYVTELSGNSSRGKILQRRECLTDEAKVIRNALRLITESEEYSKVYKEKAKTSIRTLCGEGDQDNTEPDLVKGNELHSGDSVIGAADSCCETIDDIRALHEGVQEGLKGLDEVRPELKGDGNGEESA